MLDHVIGILGPRGQARLVAVVGAHIRAQMHARRVHRAEERLAGGDLPLDKIDRSVCGLVVWEILARIPRRRLLQMPSGSGQRRAKPAGCHPSRPAEDLRQMALVSEPGFERYRGQRLAGAPHQGLGPFDPPHPRRSAEGRHRPPARTTG
jgi:hypothetical protein